MEIYLVGGAVRDHLLGLPIKEKDWVVVGSTEAEMLSQGFIKVGKDFPVFLHPQTHEEYALARTERKVGKGYYGFECYAAPDVTLEQDLLRRDITINAMAAAVDGSGHIISIIDPYHGQNDIKKHSLHHISDAFKEDPVRILRVARFAARFAELKFTVAKETIQFMQEMVNAGEINELVPERVWQEWQQSLIETKPDIFLEVLHQCGALVKLFPDIDTVLHKVLTLLKEVSAITSDPKIRFAATLLHVAKAKELCQQYKVPNEYQDLGLKVREYHSQIIASDLSPEALLTLLGNLDAWRRAERFQEMLMACEAISPDKKTTIHKLQKAYEITNAVKPTEFVEQGLKGYEIQAALQEKRLQALKMT